MLKGIKIKPISRFPDERGFFYEVMRKDWKDLFGEDTIAQANHSFTYPNIIRAWHRHLKGQTDYFLALKGTIKICAFDDKTSELDEIVSSGLNFNWCVSLVIIGMVSKQLAMNLRCCYFTTNLYDTPDPDEERRAWDDPTLIPKIINGKKDDARVGKPWDWNYPPISDEL